MKTTHRFASLLLPISFAAILSAQTAAPADTENRGPRPGRGHGPGHPIVRALDTDKNHEISAAEIANASAALLALDADKDGNVSKAELRPMPVGRPAGAPEGSRRPAPPEGAERTRPVDLLMLALDANADGALSADEISRASASLATVDADKDGKLVIDEVRPTPPEGMAPHGKKKGPRGGE